MAQSALAAGVPEAHLLKHPAPGLAGGDLGTDDEDEAAGDTEEAVGPPTPRDPMQVAVVQLTRLVSEMAKEKKQPSRGLEQLLDKAEGGGQKRLRFAPYAGRYATHRSCSVRVSRP